VGALDEGLALYILRYNNEIRAADKYFADIPEAKADPEMVDLATKLITENTSPFNPSQFHNTYAMRLNELVQQKAKGKKLVVQAEEERPKRSNVVDLMDALRKSVTGGKSGNKPTPAKKGGGRKK
jgi:DNA end-binding protein Ku